MERLIDRGLFLASLASVGFTACSGTARFAPAPALVSDATGKRSRWTVAGFYNGGYGVSVDSRSGDVFIAADLNVVRLTRSGMKNTTYRAPLVRCRSVAFDAARGGVWAGDEASSSIFYFDVSARATPIGGHSIRPAGLAFDSALSELFVSDMDNKSILKVSTSGAAQVVAPGFKEPRGIAIDSATKTLYVADRAESSIIVVLPSGTRSRVGSGFALPEGVARSVHGDIFVADAIGLSRISPAGAVERIVNAGPAGAQAVAVDDSDGSVYLVMAGTVYKVTP